MNALTSGITYRGMNVDRVLFPTKGRLERKIRRHAADGWFFCGCIPWTFWLGPFMALLVFEQR